MVYFGIFGQYCLFYNSTFGHVFHPSAAHMTPDSVDLYFDRFKKEVRAEIDKKTNSHAKLAQNVNTLTERIALLKKDKNTEVERTKAHDIQVLRDHTEQTNELQRKLKKQKLEHDESVESIAEGVRKVRVKEKEMESMKSTIAGLTSTIESNKVQAATMSDAIDDYVVKIELVELEIESVRVRNKQIHAENKKLKELAGVKEREQEHQKAEMATFRPRMLDMADRMVTEYKKINKQLIKIHEKQKRIIAEKTAIIMQLQKADVSTL